MKMFAFVSSAVLLATAATAQPSSGGNSSAGENSATENRTASQAPSSEAEEPICRRIQTTGSRTARVQRVCMTREQWEQHDRGR